MEARYVGSTEDGLRVVTLWESKAHADRFFAETLGRLLATALGPEPVGRPEMVGVDVARTYVRQPVDGAGASDRAARFTWRLPGPGE